MILTDDFDEAHAAVEEESQFLPFVGGEAAQIELWAAAAKRCLGVPASAVLDPWDAATRAGIRVLGDEYFETRDHEIRVPLTAASASWSGGALPVGSDYLIILNPLHDRVRQRTTLAEELTHIVMGTSRVSLIRWPAPAPMIQRSRPSLRSWGRDAPAI